MILPLSVSWRLARGLSQFQIRSVRRTLPVSRRTGTCKPGVSPALRSRMGDPCDFHSDAGILGMNLLLYPISGVALQLCRRDRNLDWATGLADFAGAHSNRVSRKSAWTVTVNTDRKIRATGRPWRFYDSDTAHRLPMSGNRDSRAPPLPARFA